ncbi:MAG: aminotransferase class V-fold PLP-dependent enzyme, partial [Bacteroidota bacterium]
MLTDTEIQRIRSRFSIFERKIYLNTCSQGALSDAVQAGLEQYIASWHEQGSPWDLWVQRYEEARTAFARFIHASPDEVAVISSASAGINSIASALDFRERKKVVLGEFEFPTMGHIWLAQRSRGAEVHFVNAEDNRLPAARYERFIDRDTLIVPLTHVCFKNGFRSEVRAITEVAHQSGALVMLDDYQDCGTRPVDVKAMDLDFYVTGTLKYLLGPPGLAFLYVRRELIAGLVPTMTGWFAQKNPFAFDPRNIDLSSSARRFESGTPAIPNLYAAMPGLQLLQDAGMDNVQAHIQKLAQSLLRWAAAAGVRVKTPLDSNGPLVILQAKDSARLVQELG